MSSSLEEKLEEKTAELFRLKAQLRQEIEACQRIQKALSESNNLLRAVIEASPEPIFVKDLQGCYQLINASVSRLFQKPISEIIGQDDTALFPPEVATKTAADERRIIASGQSETFEETAIATQEQRTYLTTKTVYRDPQGNPLGIVGFAREITNLKQAHEALCLANEELELRVDQRTAALQATNEQLVKEITECQQVNAELEAIFKAIPDAIVFAAPNRQMRRLNPGFTSLFGYSPEEVLGQQTATLYASQEDYEHQGRVRFNLSAQEKLKPYEVNYRRQNGEVFVGETVGTVVKDAIGKTLGYVGIIRDVSERKQAEEILKYQKEILQTIVENIPVMLAFYDATGRIKFANRALENTLGWSVEELQDLDLLSECYPDPDYRQQILNSMLNPAPGWLDLKTRIRDGRILDTSWTNVRLCDGTSIGIGQDITEQKRMEETLQASIKELADIKFALDQAAIVAITDDQGTINYVNDKFCQISQYSQEELLGQNHRLINSGYHSKTFFQQMWATISSGKVWQGEIQNRAKDGTYYWMDTTIVPFLNSEGKPYQYVAILKDITESKRAQAALRESQEQYTLAVRGSGDGLWDWNILTDEVYYSPRFKHILGYEEQEIADHFNSWESRLHPDDRDRTLEAVQQHLERRIPYDVEYRLHTKTGDYLWIRDRGQAIWDETGNATRMAGSISDITPLKQAQEALRQANTELEQRVQERTAELARSNQELELFAYVASHDLQEPLRKISSFTKLLAEDYQGHLDAEADEYIAYIIDGALRMQNQIDDLLTYSRVSRDELRKEPTELGKVVGQVLEDLSVTIEENKAAIAVSSLPTVQANPREIAQLLQNLISNGIKFRSEAPPQIQIEAQLQPEQWLISVRDNGIGINPKFAGRIFEIFQRLHSRTKYAGTGIGLAICRKIVERHGGRIWVESELGQGATFYFTIPWE